MKKEMTFKEEMKAIWENCQNPIEVDSSTQHFEEYQPTSKNDIKAISICFLIIFTVALFVCII